MPGHPWTAANRDLPGALERADTEIEWFWDAAIRDIDVAFYRPYEKVVDLAEGKPWAKW